AAVHGVDVWRDSPGDAGIRPADRVLCTRRTPGIDLISSLGSSPRDGFLRNCDERFSIVRTPLRSAPQSIYSRHELPAGAVQIEQRPHRANGRIDRKLRQFVVRLIPQVD